MRLVPDPKLGKRYVVPCTNDTGISLSLEVSENHKYTDVARLSIDYQTSSPLLTSPAFVLRICRDAKVAEVLGYHNHSQFKPDYDYPNQNMLHRDEKHQINRLLGELLDYFIQDKSSVPAEILDQLLS